MRRIAGDSTGRAIAHHVGVPEAKVSYWRSGSRFPSVSEAINFSRAYGRPPLEGLVAAGFLDADDVAESVVVKNYDIEQFTDTELADELVRRAAARQSPPPERNPR